VVLEAGGAEGATHSLLHMLLVAKLIILVDVNEKRTVRYVALMKGMCFASEKKCTEPYGFDGRVMQYGIRCVDE
jgi:hypothetical protein